MRVAVVGSRSCPPHTAKLILRYLPVNTSEIVSGGAEGVDTAAAEVARLLGLPMRVFAPAYDRYGKSAPLRRNVEILTYADQVLAFWDGESRGTQQMVAECIRQGKPVRIISLWEPADETSKTSNTIPT